MLEELSLTLPRLKHYERTVPLDSEMEATLLTVYQEVICFYARSIHFFRSHKHSKCAVPGHTLAHRDYMRAQAEFAKRSSYEMHGQISEVIFRGQSNESNDCLVPSRVKLS